MRNRRHSLWSAALVTVLGGIGLASAAGSLDVSDKTCSPQLPLLASVGVHLDLFAQARSCPEHSYLPGSNFDTTVRLWVLVSTSTLAAGIVGVLLALGAGLWVRRTLRSARDWLHRRFPTPSFTRPRFARRAPDWSPAPSTRTPKHHRKTQHVPRPDWSTRLASVLQPE